MLTVLSQDLGGRLVPATGEHQLDGAVEIGVGVREALREGQWVAGLDQNVQAPRFDFVAFGLWLFDCRL
jgi:hypothetical protein